MATDAVQPGQRWIHRNGQRYRVLLLTNQQSTQASYPVTVVYQNTSNLTTWSRPLSDWHRSFTPDAEHNPEHEAHDEHTVSLLQQTSPAGHR